jgi:hypothetical protein
VREGGGAPEELQHGHVQRMEHVAMQNPCCAGFGAGGRVVAAETGDVSDGASR